MGSVPLPVLEARSWGCLDPVQLLFHLQKHWGGHTYPSCSWAPSREVPGYSHSTGALMTGSSCCCI